MTKEKKRKPAKKKIYRAQLNASDMIPDERGRLVRFEFHEKDVKLMESMATMGMTNEQISYMFNVHPDTLHAYIKVDREKYKNGDKNEHNLFSAMERGRSSASYKITKAAFEVATVDKNVQMLIWLTKSRLGWREKVDVVSDVTHTIIYETQIAGGALRQTSRELAAGETDVIDAIIDDVTEELCPNKESESNSEPLPIRTNKD